jgi:peptide/nickel transport system substrate-binding protein
MGVLEMSKSLRPRWWHAGMLTLGALAVTAFAGGTQSLAAAEKKTLVLGVDISDSRTFDPARVAQYSPPLTLRAAYDMLVTMDPGDYVTVRPALATSWERSADGMAWIFHLRDGVKFASGNPFTAADVKFSFDRLINLKDQPSEYAENIKSTEVIDPSTVKVNMVDKNQPLLSLLVAVPFAITDSKLLKGHGALSGPEAEKQDTAAEWINQNSAGAGAYRLVKWTRNSEIVLERNPHHWRGMPAFERVIIKHIGDSAAQLLTLRRGDIDVAFNLTPEQLDTFKDDPNIRILQATSLDYMYMTLTSEPEYNKALAEKACRQSVAHAIDFDGLIQGLMGGYATRPATFVPVGLTGSTEEVAKAIGYRQDLAKAKQLLADCGHPAGFSFELNYAKAAIAGTSYDIVAQKIESDLAKVGIKAELAPLNQLTLRDKYKGGKSTSVLTFWNPDAPEAYLWSQASVYRVADRVRWKAPQSVKDIVFQAAGEQDLVKQVALYRKYQEILVDQANYIILFQPIYRLATRKEITGYVPTAAGWYVDLFNVKPAM